MDAWLIVKVAVIVLVLGFMTRQMIINKNWGTFDKTSMIVWGSIAGVVLLAAIFLFIAMRQIS